MCIKEERIKLSASKIVDNLVSLRLETPLAQYAVDNAISELEWAYTSTSCIDRATLLEIYTETLLGIAHTYSPLKLSARTVDSLRNNIYYYLGVIYAWLTCKIGEN